jgi:DNA replication protein DnaC
MRQSHVAGEKLFVDYAGTTLDVIDGTTGEEAPGVVPDRAPAAPSRHDDLSLLAESHRRDHFGQGLHGPLQGSRGMTDTPQVLLAHHLKALKLPTFLREYDKLARQCAAEGTDYPRYLLRLAELELIERERRMVERRIKAAKFPTVKSLDSFDFAALPSLNKALVLELARSEYVERRENIIAVGNSGTGKSHVALGLGLAACQKGLPVGFTTAAALVHELIEARDEKRLLRLQRQLAGHKLLIVDELGYVPLSQTGAELLFEVFSQRYERGATIVTSNLPFDEWTAVFGSERLTGALLDRLTHHVHILEMNGESYRLAQSKRRSRRTDTQLIQTTAT